MQLGDSLGLATDEHGDPLQHRRRHKNSHRINTETATHRALQRKKTFTFAQTPTKQRLKPFYTALTFTRKDPILSLFAAQSN